MCEVEEALHTKSEILKGLAKGKRDYVSACVAHWTRAHNQSVIAPPGYSHHLWSFGSYHISYDPSTNTI